MCEFFEKSEKISSKEMIQQIKKYFIEHGFEYKGKTDDGISILKKMKAKNSD